MNSKIHSALLCYPYCGQIRKIDGNYAQVIGPGIEGWVDILDHEGRHLTTMEGLEGQYCVLVKGGHPRRLSQGKSNWYPAIIQWRLINDVGPTLTPQTYMDKRESTLLSLDTGQLQSALSVAWYVRLWKNETGGEPKKPLMPDSLLDRVLERRLAEVDAVEDFVHLLSAICRFPMYGINERGREKECQKFFQPSNWPMKVFLAEKPLASCRGYNEIPPIFRSALDDHARSAKTIAIDLESNGESISEFGWKNAAGVDRRINQTGLTRDELRKAAEGCICGQTAPCIVGHKLLAWDLPILQKHGVSFPESSSLWDTLLASWILEPWHESHALVVKKNAHRADVDAQACYDLFETQVSRLAQCLDGQNIDLGSLVDRLLADPTLLSRVERRDYPHDLHEALSKATVYPSCRAHELVWQKGCHLELTATENRLADPVLSPERCRHLATEQDSIQAKVVSVVVADAAMNGVEVRLSYLPPWLTEEGLQEALRVAHEENEGTGGPETTCTLYLAEDLFKLDEGEINHRFIDGQLSIAYPEGVVAVWQRSRRRNLTEKEVRDTFRGVTEGQTGRALFPVSDGNGSSNWLLYEPSGFNAGSGSWSLLPNIPEWLQVDSKYAQGLSGVNVWMPRWRDGGAIQLDVDRLFVSPDTANRPLYLSDLTHCVLNLLRNCTEDEVLLLGMRWPKEAEQLQHNLVQLGISSLHPGTPLRRLEHVYNKGLRILACDRNKISKFVQAASRLGKKLQIVLDEVPLFDWYSILNRPKPAGSVVPNNSISDILDGDSEDEEGDDTEYNDQLEYSNQKMILRGNDISEAVSTFLLGWLQGVMGAVSIESTPFLILDTRLVNHHAAIASQLPRQDVSFYSLEELLDVDSLQVFSEVCYPRRNEQEIPNNYEDYRSFLEENWGYKDFRVGTQRPAIEKLIQNKNDILLRLPTGAGKSIIFHLPALLRSSYSGRLTVVISPLRALMRDQAEGLWRKHFTESVDYLSGGRDAWVNYEVYQGILDGRIRLIFVAPERFRLPCFTEALERRRKMDGGLEFVVFDETHCISEWGFEFRPDYLFAAQYVAEWFKTMDLPGNPHRLLLTSATVTQRNRIDLERELGLGSVQAYEDLPEDMPHPIQPYIALESFDLHEDEEAPSDEKLDKIIEILKGLNLGESAALIFVRRRKDCHRLIEALNNYAAQRDSGLASLHALPFHAGLPETVKAEACDLLRNRKANVLVCTKAFGMGMDIPHLHACVHHRPPTFIEDYLQEVGRAGRDEKERLRSGHVRVTAALLYNQGDIERNLGLLHDKTVTPPDLQDFFSFCLGQGISFKGVGKALCIIPAKVRLSGTKAFDENQVTNCLFWLERMRVLRIEGRLPPFLDLRLDLPRLHRYADGSTLSARIATILLRIVKESHSAVKQLAEATPAATPSTGADSIFGRVVKELLRGVIALISPTEQVASTPEPLTQRRSYGTTSEGKRIEVSFSMSELMSSCGDISMDDLFSGLYELNKADVLSIRKRFSVMKNGVPSGSEFWALLQEAVERLLQPTGGKVEQLSRKKFESELKRWYRDFLSEAIDGNEPDAQRSDTSKLFPHPIQREVYRAIGTSLRILRYASVQLRESLTDDGVTQYTWSIPEFARSSLVSSALESIRGMRKLLECISTRESQSSQEQGRVLEVLLTDIMDALGPDIRISKLKELMKLVETAGFYGFDGALKDWVSLVTLNTQMPLEAHEPESEGNSTTQEVYTEMLVKYEIQVLRAQAMVLLATMPEESRKEYIDRYFECVKAEDLKGLLEETVGDVDDDILASNPMLQELLSQVRQERFSEEIERLNENQLDVCKAPFNRTLLVNAGPGSGKTHVLMMRCAHLIHVQRVAPAEILVLAFNRAVVYEIRDRTRTLFRALGYGSYANRLDVSTFHSFALRHQLTSDPYEEGAIEDAVHRFAEDMEHDQEFALRVAGGYKAILVDEFQDMNEDFYRVVRNLLSHCNGGGMVIGDDDQDIMTWNRRDWQRKYNQNCPLDAIHYFSEFRKSLEPEEHELTLNYRSVSEVIQSTNGMIDKISGRVGFSRMKGGAALTAFRTEHGAVEMPLDPSMCAQLACEALDRGENVAILSRSNRECRQIYETLRGSGKIADNQISLLGSEDFPLYQLRHPGALLDICRSRKDYDFVENYIWEELVEEYEQGAFADLQSGRDYLNILYALVREEVGRPRVRNLRSFIEEMRSSDVDRLKAKVGMVDGLAKVTVATVHKVKGLEYDTVLVMPSTESFPFRRVNGYTPRLESVDAAEEARLCYVAMTRARNRLYLGWGVREKKWWKYDRYEGHNSVHRYCLRGSPKEMFVSWPGLQEQVRGGLQDYIEKQVCLGDVLSPRDAFLRHGSRVVGRLSNKTVVWLQESNSNHQLRVSNVIRYTCGRYFQEHHPDFWESLDDKVKQQGWFYIVLAEEVHPLL